MKVKNLNIGEKNATMVKLWESLRNKDCEVNYCHAYCESNKVVDWEIKKICTYLNGSNYQIWIVKYVLYVSHFHVQHLTANNNS